MKKTFALLASLVLATGSFTACSDKGNNGSTASQSGITDSSQSENTAMVVTAPDVMASLTGEGGNDFIGMDEKSFIDATDGKLTKDTAVEYDDEDGEIYAKYYLGKISTMLCGRVKLPTEYDVSATVKFKKGKLNEYIERIDSLTMEETDAIFEEFIKTFKGKLPDGYEEFTPVEHGKIKEVGFTRTTNDLVISMRRDEDLHGNIYLYFSIQIYAERYHMR